jgi:hypothetical protein
LEERRVAEDFAKGIIRPKRTVQDDGAGVGAALPAGRGAGPAPLPPGAATGERDQEK